MNQIQKNEILIFISNMQKTGQNVINALIYYENTIAKKENVKQIISNVIKKVKRGQDMEKSLYEEEVISEFQYAILSSTTDKRTAYERVLNYSNSISEANIFYAKKLFTFTIVLLLVFLTLPPIIDFMHSMVGSVSTVAGAEKKEFSPFVQIIMDLQPFYNYMALFVTLNAIFLVIYYNYTYENDLETHYKIFKYRGLIDSVIYMEIINDSLSSGLNTHKTFEVLSQYMFPASSREHFYQIKMDLENNKNFIGGFKKLAINEYSIFILETSQEIGNIKEGFENALVSIKDYQKNNKEKYKNTIELIVFTVNSLVVAIYFFFITLSQIDAIM